MVALERTYLSHAVVIHDTEAMELCAACRPLGMPAGDVNAVPRMRSHGTPQRSAAVSAGHQGSPPFERTYYPVPSPPADVYNDQPGAPSPPLEPYPYQWWEYDE